LSAAFEGRVTTAYPAVAITICVASRGSHGEYRGAAFAPEFLCAKPQMLALAGFIGP